MSAKVKKMLTRFKKYLVQSIERFFSKSELSAEVKNPEPIPSSPWYSKIYCTHCGQKFVQDNMQATIYLYGIILLEGKDDGYIGTTCPQCLKTILIETEKTIFDDAVFWLNGQCLLGKSHFFEPLGYFAPFSDKGLTTLKNGVSSCSGEVAEKQRHDLNQQYLTHESENTSLCHGYYRTYIYDLADPFGAFYYIAWLTKKAIATALICEHDKNIRCFPRYIHKIPLLETIDQFSWKYSMAEKYWVRNEVNAQESINKFQDSGIEPNPLVDEPLPSLSAIEFFHEQRFEELDDDCYLTTEFHAILVDNSTFLSVLIPDEGVTAITRFQSSRAEVIGTVDPTTINFSRNLDNIKKCFKKGHSQDFLRENYNNFIIRYIEICQSSYFSAIDIWTLKYDFQINYDNYINKNKWKWADNVFVKEGNAWRIVFDGQPVGLIKHKGLDYIHYLIEHPRMPVETGELVNIFLKENVSEKIILNDDFTNTKSTPIKNGADSRDVIDEKFKKKMEFELKQLSKDREVANRNCDNAEIDRINKETEKITKHYYENVDKKGNIRKFTDKEIKDAGSVGAAIRRALKLVKKYHPELYLHLDTAIPDKKSFNIIYNPSEEITWVTQK